MNSWTCINLLEWTHYKNGGEMQKKSHQKLGYNGSTLCFKVHLCSRGWIVEDAHVPSINCGSCCGFCQLW